MPKTRPPYLAEFRQQRVELVRRLLAEVDLAQDCLRLYHLPDTRGCEVREHGMRTILL